ncbi:hypothetical protein ACP70R_010159 [Stipagrostis hirtigluma subsp. patula]
MLFSGNLLYALAYDLNSLMVLLIGRLLEDQQANDLSYNKHANVRVQISKLGSARAVNRRYISDCVPSKIRLQASAGFVSASALGMACGPALAGFLQTKFKIYSLTFNQSTLPGWVMSIAWLIYLLWLWLTFKEPEHFTKSALNKHPLGSGQQGSASLEEDLSQPFLLGTEQRENENVEDNEYSDLSSENSYDPVLTENLNPRGPGRFA